MKTQAKFSWAVALSVLIGFVAVSPAFCVEAPKEEKEEVNPRVVMRTWDALTRVQKSDHLRSWASLSPDKAEEYDLYNYVFGIVEDGNQDINVRGVAVETLEKILLSAKQSSFRDLIRRLITLMENANQPKLIRRPVIRMLGRLLNRNDPQHTVHIVSVTRLAANTKEEAVVRADAITSIGEIGRPEDMEGLLDYIDDASPDIRKAVFAILPTVIGSLQKEPSPAVIGKLRRLISDTAEDPKMRANVLNGLASFIRKQLIAGRRPTILAPILQETNTWIQTSTDKDMLNAAVEAAGKMGQAESITPLIDALMGLQGDEATPVREKICDALGMFFEVLRKGRREDVARIAEALLTVYNNQNEAKTVRVQAVYAVSSLYYKEHDKTIAYLTLADYWNPTPATPRDEKLFYDTNLEQQVRMTLKIFTDSIDFGNNYTGWMDWYRKNEALLRPRP